jgi:hypothetical protein
MTDEAEAAAKDQQRIKTDQDIPSGGGNAGKVDTTTSGGSGGGGASRAPATDADPNLKPAKPGDS